MYYSDEENYYNYLKGDNSALDSIIVKYGGLLTRYSYSYVKDFFVAEDIMEEAFATLIYKKNKFNNKSTLKTFLFSIVRHKSIDYLRKNKKSVSLENVKEKLIYPFEETVEQDEEKQKLLSVIETLNEDYKEVVRLVYFDEFSIDQTAQIMKKNKKQVYNLLSRAKERMNEEFRKN